MYNRYVPNAQGSYERQRAGTPRPAPKPPEPHPPAPTTPPSVPPQQNATKPPQIKKPNGNLFPAFRLPDRLDTGDLLVLLILLLLLQENDEDPLTLIITLAAFFLFQ